MRQLWGSVLLFLVAVLSVAGRDLRDICTLPIVCDKHAETTTVNKDPEELAIIVPVASFGETRLVTAGTTAGNTIDSDLGETRLGTVKAGNTVGNAVGNTVGNTVGSDLGDIPCTSCYCAGVYFDEDGVACPP